MAGQKSTIIEYAFQGDTLDLQQAIKQVDKLLTSSLKKLKRYQDGTLTEPQKQEVARIRKQLKIMRAAAKNEQNIDEQTAKKAKLAGKDALQVSNALSKEAEKSKERFKKQKLDSEKKLANEQKKAQEKQAAEQIKIEQTTSVAGQQNAQVQAAYLEKYAKKFSHFLTDEAYDEVIQAVEEYKAASEDTNLTQEELAQETEKLNRVYKQYREILTTLNREQQQAAKSIENFSDFLKESQRQIKVSLKSFSFWLQMIKRVVQYIKQATNEYLTLLEVIRRSGQLNNSQLSEVLEVANAWRSLSRQLEIFKMSVGSIVARTLAPLVKILSTFLMVINSLLASIGGFDQVAENVRPPIGFTNLDEINQKETTEEDQFKKIRRGWDDIKKTIEPILELFQALGKLLNPLFNLLSVPFDAFLNLLSSIMPILDVLLEPLQLIIQGVTWLLENLLNPIISVIDTITSNTWLLIAALTSVFLWLMAIKDISFIDVLTGLKNSFVGLAKSIWKAIAGLAKWFASLVAGMVKTIAATIKNWALAGSYWKIAIAGIAAAGIASVVVAGIVMAATATASNAADSQMNSDYSVPQMAKGGVVKAPTLAMIGEGQYNEAVVPLGHSSQFEAMKEGIADRTAAKLDRAPERRSSTPANVILQVNGREFARAILPDIGSVQPQTGVRVQR